MKLLQIVLVAVTLGQAYGLHPMVTKTQSSVGHKPTHSPKPPKHTKTVTSTTTKTAKHHPTSSCKYPAASPTSLPNLQPCAAGRETFAIQARGCDNPFNGYFVGTEYDATTEENLLVVNPSAHGTASTPALFYFETTAKGSSTGTLHAVPDTTSNATGIGAAPVVFPCEKSSVAGSFAFNTTAFHKANAANKKDPYAISPAVCSVGKAHGELSCHNTLCGFKDLVGGTALAANGVFGLWDGLSSVGAAGYQNATYFAVPGCVASTA